MSTTEFKAIPARPCIKCGDSNRDKRGDCKSCAKLTRLAYRAANIDKTKATAAAYRTANAEKLRLSKAKWHTENNDRAKANMAAWKAANTERKKESDAAWRAANPDRIRVTQDAWYAVNSEKAKAKSRAWQAANSEISRIQKQNKRARKKEIGGKISKDLAQRLFKLQQGKCPCCKQPLGKDFHLDHVTPLARGGPNIDSNMQLLRAVCNMNKSAKDPIQFMQQRGFLL